MRAHATPGLYRQSVEPKVGPGPLVRGDITVFLGYAARGPVAVPVRIQSLSQFNQLALLLHIDQAERPDRPSWQWLCPLLMRGLDLEREIVAA